MPPRGVLGTLARLQPPRLSEGFDALFRVQLTPEGLFVVEPWQGKEG